MLLSMKDSKNVADALANKTAQKILSYIAENQEATESELAEKLNVPLPTIHYNIQQLKKANLLKSKEFFWSKKGKKMRLFTLAKKYIIIAPSKSKTSLKQLKGLLPVALISVIGAGLISLFQRSKALGIVNEDSTFDSITKPTMETLAKQAADSGMTENVISNATNLPPQTFTEPNIALWFLLGSLFAIVLTLIINKIKKN